MKKKTGLISQQMSAQRRPLVLLGGVSLALGAAIVGQAVLLAESVEKIFVQRASLSSVAVMLVVLLGVMAARTLLSYGNGRIGLQMAARAKTDMRAAVLRKLTKASMPMALRGQTGGKVSVVHLRRRRGQGIVRRREAAACAGARFFEAACRHFV